MSLSSPAAFVLPQLESIPWLVHGFGTKRLKERDLAAMPELARFRRVSLKQVHSDIVRIVKTSSPEGPEGDALLTDQEGILLIIKTADCLPLILVDKNKVSIAAVHCGWRGTRKRLVQKVVRAMQEFFGSVPQDLLVGMGPCISRGCYEVGEDVYVDFIQAGWHDKGFHKHPYRQGKYFLDLKEVNRLQLLESGVSKEHIFSLDFCTHCEDAFLSFRRDRKTRGRMMNFVGISPYDRV